MKYSFLWSLATILLIPQGFAGRLAPHSTQVRLQTVRFAEALSKNTTQPLGPNIVANGQSEDSRKDGFVMPSFDRVARVRAEELKGFFSRAESKHPKEIEAKWGVGGYWNGSLGAKSSTASRGILKDVWETEKFGVRIPAFEKWRKAIVDYLTLDDYMKITLRNPSFKPTTPGGLSMADHSSIESMTTWLRTNYKYNAKYGERLAESYVTMSPSERTLDNLAAFAELDTSRDCQLDYTEVHESLSAEESPVDTRISWKDVARVENTDFAGLGFPSGFTNDILATLAPQGKIASAVWADKDLSLVLTDYVDRDKRKEDAEGKLASETFSGRLKFFQMADIFPTDCDATTGKIVMKFDGQETEATAPNLDQLSGKERLLTAKPEDVQHWLELQGYKNGGRWFSESDKYATIMARQVVKWGCGMIPGVERPGEPHLRLAGPKGDEDQFTDVACRLAGFVQFDTERHGKLRFAQALPILYESLHPSDVD